ncbi:hypothetical protein BDV96DRAFT_650392 [Lophiotrema nucula]|uniref:Protein kinase domain-containing protein n=1 Tax=Lophiotrema nucula TaxID=690887 RepID=A0A6A5YYU6_9PLEO|nr:hypothetical protein BDV96DRAFT_650392 [Lophiotrema nucula]
MSDTKSDTLKRYPKVNKTEIKDTIWIGQCAGSTEYAAVKIATDGQALLTNSLEAIALQKISRTAALADSNRFPTLLEPSVESVIPDKCPVLATKFISPGLTLDNFEAYYKGFLSDNTPIEFIAHLFLELCDVVGLLHDNTMAHKDLQHKNILIDLRAPQDTTKMPKLALIDFGFSVIRADDTDKGFDAKSIRDVLARFENFEAFANAVGMTAYDWPISIAELKHTWGGEARKWVSDCTLDQVSAIWDVANKIPTCLEAQDL